MNSQKPESRESSRLDGSLDVIKIWKTIQGEGPLAGTPAVFVRLAGCNLVCPQCDTDYTTGRHRLLPDQIGERIFMQQGLTKLVVITGGEPFRQFLAPLVQFLVKEFEYNIQIETNGIIYEVGFPYLSNHVMIVCSPKTAFIEDRVKPFVHTLKYVLHHEHVNSNDGLPNWVLGRSVRPCRPWADFPRDKILVQPEDDTDHETNHKNLMAATKSCMAYGYRLGIQMHKLLGVE